MTKREKIKEVISYITDVDVNKLTEDTPLFEELGVNSFEMIRIIYEIENCFGVNIEKDSYSEFRNIGDICRYVEKGDK